jgi:hypothetical protein
MEVNYVVALKFHPTKFEVIFNIKNILNTADHFDTTSDPKMLKTMSLQKLTYLTLIQLP